jgi:hypothetical protein
VRPAGQRGKQNGRGKQVGANGARRKQFKKNLILYLSGGKPNPPGRGKGKPPAKGRGKGPNKGRPSRKPGINLCLN